MNPAGWCFTSELLTRNVRGTRLSQSVLIFSTRTRGECRPRSPAGSLPHSFISLLTEELCLFSRAISSFSLRHLEEGKIFFVHLGILTCSLVLRVSDGQKVRAVERQQNT